AGNNSTQVIRKVTLRCELSDGLVHPQGQVIEADLGDLTPGQARTDSLDTLVANKPGRLQAQLTATADNGQATQAVAVLTVSEAALAMTQEARGRQTSPLS